jgi:amidohydrolase
VNIKLEAEKIESYLIDLRRKIHENPELGFQEHETAKLICSELDKLQIPYVKGVAITGIVATLDGKKGPGKTLLIRADMDALPLIEETNLPFKSKNHGVFHACGHDSHVSCLLGTAKILKERVHEFNGSVKFVFQPAEETSTIYDSNGSGGALPMITESPKLFNHNAALALHIVSSEEDFDDLGKIVIKDGPHTGSADEIFITVKGKGGHASAPHSACDPVYIASQIYVNLQGFLSRTVDPVEPHVFTAGKIVGGFRHNIISETCFMECTLRTLNEELRNDLLERIPTFVKQIAQAFGGDAIVDVKRGYPVGKNSSELNALIAKTVIELYGEEKLYITEKAILGAEDFYEFGFKNKIPIAMFWLGGSNKKTGKTHHNHSNYFDFDEKALPVGVSILVGTTLRYLNT